MDGRLEKAVIKGKNGDIESLTEIYNETKNMVYFTVLKLTNSESDAQDLVQDTYIKAFQNLGMLQDEKSFIKWLKTIAINLSKNYLKKCKPLLFKTDENEEQALASIPEISEDFLPAEYVDRQEKCRLIMEIVDSLPDLQRTAVLLYYFDELHIGEVARIMETSEGTTKSRLNYARKQIKEEVEAQEKKGTKLYGVLGIPMLTKILHNASKDYPIPAGVSGNILQACLEATSLEASTSSASAAAAGSKAAFGAANAAGTGTAGLAAKFMASPLAAKIIAGVVAAGIIVGGGIGISRIVGNTNPPVYKSQSGDMQTGRRSPMENREWEELLGKTKEEVISLLGEPGSEEDGELYYDVYQSDANGVLASVKIHLSGDNIVDMVSCAANNHSTHGIKKGDTLKQVKSTFASVAGASLDQENVDCGSLSAIFYTIGDYSYQFLYDKNEIVNHFAVSLIRDTTIVEEPAQDNGQQQESEGDKQGTLPAEQAPNVEIPPQTQTQAPPVANSAEKTAVEDLIFASKADIINKLGKPINDSTDGSVETLLYDGIMIIQDLENKELNGTTHQYNYLMIINSDKYSAYGFYTGMTKEEFLRNKEIYGPAEESDGVYEFAFPGGGTARHLYVDFSMGRRTAFEVTLQAFVTW